MFTYFRIFIIIIAIVSINSCKNDPQCVCQDSISGDIVKIYDIGKCYDLMELDTIIINSKEDMDILSDTVDITYYNLNKDYCDLTTVDTIDFKMYSIIGYF